MTTTDDRAVARGWFGWLLRGVLTVGVGLAGLGASCVEPHTPGGDAEEPSDTGASVDAASSGNCRSVETVDACDQRARCQWLTATCDGGRVIGGCFAGAGWRDAGPDCSAHGDAGSTDADTGVSGCEAVGDESVCRGRSECRWWTSYCGSRLVEARCIDRGDFPESPDCDTADVADATPVYDAGTDSAADGGATADTRASDASTDDVDGDTDVDCRMHSNETDCQSDGHCKWWVDACDDYVVEETCIPEDESPSSTTCKETPRGECHEVDDEGQCQPPNCEWVAEGCGSGPSGTEEVTSCLPEGRCSGDGDCPSDHQCVTLWTDVCYGSACQACGGETSRCVPNELLKP